MRKLLLLLLAVWCVTACTASAAAENDEEKEWTVMFYMCGSDLESRYGYATGNLLEITASHSVAVGSQALAEQLELDNGEWPNEVNVVLETGGCKKWHNLEDSGRTTDAEIRTDVLQRWAYDPYEDAETAEIRLKEELPLASMSDPETLSDFIRWSAQEYPAKKYMLVLWDHGGGSRTGIFVDELFQGDIMYLYELGQALRDGGVQIEAVLFDACLMANLETACMIDDSARWMIASEEVVTGEGTAISTWLTELCTRPGMDGRRLGRIICDSAQEKCARLGDEQGAQLLTWSVIDLSRIEEVADCMEELCTLTSEIYPRYPEMMSVYLKKRNMAEKYGNREDKMMDLYDVVLLSPTVHETGIAMRNEILDLLEETVVYCVRGSGRAKARGLSFCFGVEMTNEELDIYARNCPNPHYVAMLDAITPWTAPEELYETVERLPEINDLEAYDIVVERRMGADGTPGVALVGSDINVSRITCGYFKHNEETGNVILLGYVPTAEFPTTDGQKQQSIIEPWYWPCAGNEFCSLGMIEYVYGECLFEIPVQIDTNIWRLRCGYEREKGYDIYGVWEGYNSSSNMFNRNVVSLSKMAGQSYRMVYPIMDPGKNVWTGGFEHSAAQTMTRALPVESRLLPPGTYYIEYMVEDMFMRQIPMDWVEVHWDGKNLTLAEGESWEGTEELHWK